MTRQQGGNFTESTHKYRLDRVNTLPYLTSNRLTSSMPEKTESISSRLIIFALIVVILSFAYMPLLQGNFLYWDDYNLWGIKEKGDCAGYYGSRFVVELGRPMMNHIFCTTTIFLDTINDASTIRFAGILFLSLLVYLISRLLRSQSNSEINSVLVPLIIATLPAFQITVGAITLQSFTISCLFAVAAFFVAKKGATYLKDGWEGALNRYTIFAILSFQLSLLTYQITGMFYWVMVGGFLLGIPLTEWKKKQRTIYYLLGVGLVSMMIYFIYAKLNFIIMHDFINEPVNKSNSGYGIVFTTGLIAKLKWFFQTILKETLNLWSFYPTNKFAAFTGGIILSGLVLGSIRGYMENKSLPNSKLVESFSHKFILVTLIVFLCFAPCLVANTFFGAHRAFTALMPFTVLLIYWALNNLSLFLKWWFQSFFVRPSLRHNILTAILIPTSLFGMQNAHFNTMHYMNFGQTLEIRYLKSAFRQNDLSKYQRIHIIMLDAKDGGHMLVFDWNKPGRSYSDYEFGGSQTWTRGNTNLMLITILSGMSDEPELRDTIQGFRKNGKLSMSFKNQFKGFDEKTLVIDMTRLYKFY